METMYSKPAQRLAYRVLFTAAFGCLMKLASGGIIDGACGTGINKNTGEKVRFSKFLTDSDMFDSAYDLPPKTMTAVYEVNCKESYIRTCSVNGSPKTNDRPDAAVCRATLFSGKSTTAAKETDVAKNSAAKATASINGKKDVTGVETVNFDNDRNRYFVWKNYLTCTLTCHCYAAADLDCKNSQ